MRPWCGLVAVVGLTAIACNSVNRGTAFSGGQNGGGALSVTSTIPEGEAVDVPLTTVISATFDDDLDTATVTPESFSVTTAGGLPVSGELVKTARTVSLEPDPPLSPLTLYVATLTTAIADVDGDTLAGPFVWRFTTRN